MATLATLRHQLRAVREGLFWELDGCKTARELWGWQNRIAEAIRSAETAHSNEESKRAAKHHLNLLRELGDAAAWRLLHPHAIRQLAKCAGPHPPKLTSQGAHTEFCLRVCEKIAESDTYSLVSDLTHDLGLGDVVVADDAEAPTLIECKAGTPHAMDLVRGRSGRQYSRMRGTAEYMRKGHAQVHGEDEPRRCLDVPGPTSYIWETLQRVGDEALARGSAVQEVEAGRVLIVTTRNVTLGDALDQHPVTLPALARFHYTPEVGVSQLFIERDAPLMPPPAAWEVSPELQLAAFEGDLVVTQLLDPAALERGVSQADVHLKAVSVDGTTHFTLSANGVEALATQRHLHLLKYHFWTMESVCDALRHAAANLQKTVDDLQSEPVASRGRPVLLQTEEDIEALISDFKNYPKDTQFVFAPELRERLDRERGRPPEREPEAPGAIFLYERNARRTSD